MTQPFWNRRELLFASAVSAAACVGLPRNARAEDAAITVPNRIYKTLKIGMVRMKGASLVDRFKAAKEAGFDGIEMNSPGMNVDETRKAIADARFPVDGTVCSSHWAVRHTDPNAETRAKALENLKTAIRDTHAVGGNTVLLVVGHGKDGSEEEIWPRAVENIAKALPIASWYGIHIAIENVWNHFLYDHGGKTPDQKPDKLIRFADEFNSPWVGFQFDIGNHQKYGNPADWIRAMGKRIVKLDVKGFDRGKSKFTKIGEGDIDWPDVRKALGEIGYTGWAAAEVGGGGPERLKEIATNLDQHVLGR